MSKAKLYDVIALEPDRKHAIPYLAHTITNVMGYENSQAQNCALILSRVGRYKIGTFKHKELDHAKLVVASFIDAGLFAQIQQRR